MLLVPKNSSAPPFEPRASSPDIEMKDNPRAIEEEDTYKNVENDKFSFDGHEYMRLKKKSSLAFGRLAEQEGNKLQHLTASLGPEMTVWLDYRMAKEKQKVAGQGRSVTRPKGIPPLYGLQNLDYDPLCRDGLSPEQELREVERCRAVAEIVFPGIFEETTGLYIEQPAEEVAEILAALERTHDFNLAAANHRSNEEMKGVQTDALRKFYSNFRLDERELLDLLEGFPDFEPGTPWVQQSEATGFEQTPPQGNSTVHTKGINPQDSALPSPKRVKLTMETVTTEPADNFSSLPIAQEDHIMGGMEVNNEADQDNRGDNGNVQNTTHPEELPSVEMDFVNEVSVTREADKVAEIQPMPENSVTPPLSLSQNNGQVIGIAGVIPQPSPPAKQRIQYARANVRDGVQDGVLTETRLIAEATSTIKVDEISEAHLILGTVPLATNHVSGELSEDEGEIIEPTQGTKAPYPPTNTQIIEKHATIKVSGAKGGDAIVKPQSIPANAANQQSPAPTKSQSINLPTGNEAPGTEVLQKVERNPKVGQKLTKPSAMNNRNKDPESTEPAQQMGPPNKFKPVAMEKHNGVIQATEPTQIIPLKKWKPIAIDKRNQNIDNTEAIQETGTSTKGRSLKSTYKKIPQVSGPKKEDGLESLATSQANSASTSVSYDWSWGAAVQPNRPGGQGSRHLHPPPPPPPFSNLQSFRGQGPNPIPQGYSSSPHSVHSTSSQVLRSQLFSASSISRPNPNPRAVLGYSQSRAGLTGPISGSHTNPRGRPHNHPVNFSTPAGRSPSSPPRPGQFSGSQGSSLGNQMHSFARNGSPTPARSPGGSLHRGGGRGRGRVVSPDSHNASGGSQLRTNSRLSSSPSFDDTPIPFNLVRVQSPLSSSLEFANCRFPSRNLRDDALALIQDAILRTEALRVLSVVEPHADEVTLRISGPLGSNVRGTVRTMFPSARITAFMA